MTLNNSPKGHTDSTSSSLTIDRAGDTSSVNSTCSHLNHLLQFTCLSKGNLVKRAKLKWHHNISWITVGKDCLTGANLKLRTTRHTGSIHSHHWVNSQCQGINTSTKLSIQSLLTVVSLLTDTSAPEAVRNHIPREGDNRAILHHVRVFFNLKQSTFVTDNDDSLNVFTVFFSFFSILDRHD